tara:strand:+ start:1861 stop:2061 length:201 start_codon:yes stop_codon:yes gene_type:complete
MSYLTNKTIKKRIDKLLGSNAAYQASNVCVDNSKTKRQDINRHCRVNFINPIKDIDKDFYNQIILQ